MDTPPFIYSSVDGRLDYFHFLAMMNGTFRNTHVYILLCVKAYVFIYFGYLPVSGITGLYNDSTFKRFLNFKLLMNCQTIS